MNIQIKQIKTHAKKIPVYIDHIHECTREERIKQLGIYGNLYFEPINELIAIIREQDRLINRLQSNH